MPNIHDPMRNAGALAAALLDLVDQLIDEAPAPPGMPISACAPGSPESYRAHADGGPEADGREEKGA
jgi:hypothetical protein